ncbi:MAG: hypothetical protein OEW77_01365 [Gemmatimonadota bacterium]|nr:hypothetical protein [Gemmatimonadota bacterium]
MIEPPPDVTAIETGTPPIASPAALRTMKVAAGDATVPTVPVGVAPPPDTMLAAPPGGAAESFPLHANVPANMSANRIRTIRNTTSAA